MMGKDGKRAWLTRRNAAVKLAGVLARVKEANANPEFAYRVRHLIVFGSFVSSDREKLGDLDMGMTLEPRGGVDRSCFPADLEGHRRQCSERIKLAVRDGRRFGNSTEQVFWPQTEGM